MPNRLANETSPYLRQHADNPVDWYPWGDDALQRARREDRPILLSVGYSACHWCHVMAHESFEDAATAAVMNRLFVNIKVDREERPDLDQIYQLAHQMLARRPGGWPLTMFLSPDGTPFFGGTYFPPEPRHGLPGFADLCEHIAAAWREKRVEIGAQDGELRRALSQTVPRRAAGPERLDAAPMQGLLESLRERFDARDGGFGDAPKFPHPADLEACLRAYATRADRQALEMAALTLARMCDGGIFDHVGGGFSRYSVDRTWTIPHFEKMLYDNGPLLHLLADAWLATGDPRLARCAELTAAWILREMQSPEGGYYASLDADSEHEEGKFYVWQPDDVRAIVSADEWRVVAPHFGLDGGPNFEGRHWHLRVVRPLDEVAGSAGLTLDGAQRALESARAKLLAARARRVPPGRDEKILVSWNALAIRGMAHAGRVFAQPDWVASARRALDFVRRNLWREGRLLATYKDGRAHLNGYLDDYAFLLAALLELLQARYSADDLAFAAALGDALLERFEDPEDGGYFFTARDHEELIHRPKPGPDNATPSGNGVAAWALQRLSALTGEPRYARSAERALELFHPSMRKFPAAFATLATALVEALDPPSLLVLRGEPAALEDWSRALAGELLPDTLVVALPDAVTGLPAVLDKPIRPGPVHAWLCRGTTCLAPMDDLESVKRACRARAAAATTAAPAKV